MATAYTALLGLALPVTGELSGSWGDTVNVSITSLLDSAISGTTTLSTDADVTLTTSTGVANQSRQAIILWNPASGTVTRNITAPAHSKIYTVINASGGTQSIVIRGAGPTTGVTVIKGESAQVAWNGSDFVKISSSAGDVTVRNLTVTGTTTLSGNQVINVTDNTNAALQITQLGTGNALLVEDSTNPDSTPFVIAADGKVVVGSTTAPTISGVPQFQVAGVGTAASSQIGFSRWDNSASSSAIQFAKSRSGVIGTQGAVSSGDAFGQIQFYGDDGTAFVQGANITASVDGTPGLNDMPGRLVFSTTADGASSPTERMRINNTGLSTFTAVGTGGVLGTGASFVGTNLSGATTNLGIGVTPTFGTGATVRGIGVQTTVATQAGGAGLGTAAGFRAAQGVFDTAVTSQYGFWADSTITGATNNYGFYSNIAAGTGRYNFYAAGTADNYFGGSTTINVTDNTNAALRITQLGTGNALLVEDSANPDASPFVVDQAGTVLVGATNSRSFYLPGFSGVNYTPGIQGSGQNYAQGGAWMALSQWSTSTTVSGGAFISLNKSNSATVGTHAIVGIGQRVGGIGFAGSDGALFQGTADIFSEVDGTPSLGIVPGRLTFATASSSGGPVERMRIDSAGRVGIGGIAAVGESVRLASGLTGATTAYGYRALQTVASDVTTRAVFFGSFANTAAASFTLSSLEHFAATQQTIGAGSAVTNQYGFVAGSSLIGATNNYGFYSNIASGTGRYNFYAAGTADNYFAGNVVIGKTTANSLLNVNAGDNILTTYPIRVDNSANNYGSGYGAYGMSNRVNASALNIDYTFDIGGDAIFKTSDTERMRITPTGKVGFGTPTPTAPVEVLSTDSTAVNLAATDGQLGVGATLALLASPGSNTNVTQIAFQSRAAQPWNRIVSSGGSTPYLSFVTNNAEAIRIQADGSLQPGVRIAGTSTSDALRITQTGTGNALLVEDAANPDSTPFVIDNSGNVISGYGTSVVTAGSAVAPRIQLHGAGGGSAAMGATSWATGGNVAASFVFSRSEGSVVGTQTIVDSGDHLGNIRFAGSDGVAFIEAAKITGEVDGTPGLNDMPGRLVFSTTADGASSPTERMRLDSSGNLGLGVTPSAWSLSGLAALQVKNGSLYGYQNEFGAQANTYYNAGWKYITTAPASQYTQSAGAHAWYTAPSGTAGNAISFTQAMTLDASGNLLVGTTSVNAKCTVASSSGSDVYAAITTNTQTGYLYNSLSTSVSNFAYMIKNNANVGAIYCTTSSTTYVTSSDYRLKDTIAPMTGALAKVSALKPCTYKWKVDGSDGQGFIAHELQEVVPECVVGEKDAVDAEGKPVYQGIDTSFLVATLTAAIQEQQAIITALTARVAALESK